MNSINIGDEVTVYLRNNGVIRGIVNSLPMIVGDCWRIETDTAIVNIQEYGYMVKMKSVNPVKEPETNVAI